MDVLVSQKTAKRQLKKSKDFINALKTEMRNVKF